MRPRKTSWALSIHLSEDLEPLFYFPSIPTGQIRDLAMLIQFGNPKSNELVFSQPKLSQIQLTTPIDYHIYGAGYRMDPYNMPIVARPRINILKPTIVTLNYFIRQVIVRLDDKPINDDHSFRY